MDDLRDVESVDARKALLTEAVAPWERSKMLLRRVVWIMGIGVISVLFGSVVMVTADGVSTGLTAPLGMGFWMLLCFWAGNAAARIPSVGIALLLIIILVAGAIVAELSYFGPGSGLTFLTCAVDVPLVLCSYWGTRIFIGLGTHECSTGLCRRCGYDLRGTTSERCSECGELLAPRAD